MKILLFILISFSAFAQQPEVDSLSTAEENQIEQELMNLKNKPIQANATEETTKKLELDKSFSNQENEIPVLTKATNKPSTANSSSWLRVTLGLSVVGLFLLGMYLLAQKWIGKKKKENPHTSIRVTSMHYIGPKKSLAIVSVAGESILIGITDQNISHLKTLSLLDEDIPEKINGNFQQSLQEAESDEDIGPDDFAVKGVRDMVSTKLKGMRNLW